MTGIAAIQSRIAEIQTRIEAVSSPRSAASGDAFATALSSAVAADAAGALLGGAGTSGASGVLGGLGLSGVSGLSGTSGFSGLNGLAGLSGVGATAASGTGAALVESASKYLGVPYVWGGESASGMDCSGLVQRALADIGVSVPRTARAQMTVGTAVPSLAQAQPGDLIVTRGGAHIGIYLGDNKILHAPRPGEKVSIRELFETDADINTIRRVLPPATATTGLPGMSGTTSDAVALGLSDPVRLALQLTTGGLS
ncbi:C40 family peptidase [Georgenia sp. SYP-B2076]|uniref:C40 family peptidase n=1 Tax=Georgenia sp. SYP-B2076 TaxID=2495881 RepID=UPI000F8F622F|nr:C40 family peptidase [Georgenia sp. SYP-B2076]